MLGGSSTKNTLFFPTGCFVCLWVVFFCMIGHEVDADGRPGEDLYSIK